MFSSSPIPGNTISVNRVIDKLYRAGADVIHHKISDIHTSGHGKQEEQKLMICMLKPTYFLPIHGEYRMLKAHVNLATQCGVPSDNCFVLDNGDVLEISSQGSKISGKVPAQPVYVDGNGIGDIGNIVLRDRRALSQNGLVIITLTIDRKQKKLLSPPVIMTRGFVYVRGAEDLIKELEQLTGDSILSQLSLGTLKWSQMKKRVIEAIEPFLFRKTGRRPLILPIFMEV